MERTETRRRYGLRRLAVVALLFPLLCGSAPVFGHQGHDHGANDQDTAAVKDRPKAPRQASRSRWGANYFPNVPLVTHEGKSVRFFDDLLKDKVVVINFIYTSCLDACPLDTARLAQVHHILGDRVGRDIFMYSITIDPERDTPEVLAQYAARFHVGPGWLFLTGKEADILLLRKKLGLYMAGLDEELKDHNMSLLIGNQRTGQWMKRSPMDSPYFIAEQVGTWLTNWETPSALSNQNYAHAPELRIPSMGENLFRSRCSVCHTIGTGNVRTVGGGERIEASQRRAGPDLLGVTQKRDRAWLARWLAEPDKMLAEKDPIAMELYAKYDEVLMPNLRLNDVEVGALITYMDAESRRVEKLDYVNKRIVGGESREYIQHSKDKE